MLVYAFLFLPILVMAVFAFNKPSAPALASFHGTNVCTIPPAQIGNIAVWNGFTGCWFSAGLHDPAFIPAIIVSLQIAAEASVVATVLGNVTILIGQVVFNASLTMLIIRARFVGMGDTLEEAAYDLGSGPLATFRQITLPRLAPAIVAAALLSFTFSFDDYVLPAFTNGTTNTWPIVLYSAVRFGLTPAVNALATIMLGVTLAAVIVTAVVLRRSRRRVTAGQRGTVLPALRLAGHGPVDADLLPRRRDRGARLPAPFGDHYHAGRHQGQPPERQVGELAPVSHVHGHAALLVRADAALDPQRRRVFRCAV